MLVDLPDKLPGVDDPFISKLTLLLGESGHERITQGIYLAGVNYNHVMGDLIVDEYPLDSSWKIIDQYSDADERREHLREAFRKRHDDFDAGKLVDDYGVVDTPEQFKEKFGQQLIDDPRQFVVTFSIIRKADQSPQYGWRWHKWGTYYGDKNPQYEYLYDEGPEIQEVYAFHVYEVKVDQLTQGDSK